MANSERRSSYGANMTETLKTIEDYKKKIESTNNIPSGEDTNLTTKKLKNR